MNVENKLQLLASHAEHLALRRKKWETVHAKTMPWDSRHHAALLLDKATYASGEEHTLYDLCSWIEIPAEFAADLKKKLQETVTFTKDPEGRTVYRTQHFQSIWRKMFRSKFVLATTVESESGAISLIATWTVHGDGATCLSLKHPTTNVWYDHALTNPTDKKQMRDIMKRALYGVIHHPVTTEADESICRELIALANDHIETASDRLLDEQQPGRRSFAHSLNALKLTTPQVWTGDKTIWQRCSRDLNESESFHTEHVGTREEGGFRYSVQFGLGTPPFWR